MWLEKIRLYFETFVCIEKCTVCVSGNSRSLDALFEGNAMAMSVEYSKQRIEQHFI